MNTITKRIIWGAVGAVCGGGLSVGISILLDKNGPTTASKGSRSGWTPPSEESTDEDEDPAREPNKAVSEGPGDEDDEEDNDTVAVVCEYHKAAPMKSGAVFIDESQFYHEEDDFAKNHGLVYYQGDHVFLDENGEVIIDPEKIFGEDVIEMLAYRIDGDVLCLRNDELKTDYELSIDSGSYHEEEE